MNKKNIMWICICFCVCVTTAVGALLYGRYQEKKDAGVVEQYVEKYLHDYGYAKWVSAEPDIWFVVYGEEKDDKYQDVPRGIMTLGEEQIPFVIHFDEEKGVRFRFLMGKVFLFQKLRRTILRRSFSMMSLILLSESVHLKRIN